VRDAALKAIAVRAYNLHQLDPPQELTNPDLEPTLTRLASDENARVRWQVAYAMGQIGSPAAMQRLQVMLDDSSAHTRYNAAVALARHGNAKAVETLAEMLDVDELAAVRDEESEGDQRFERTLLISSAIGAARSLAQQNPKADLSPITKALDRMSKADPAALEKAHVEPRIAAEAELALKALKDSRKRSVAEAQ
jgi:HEAT repeats